jgi:PAS domain S-box-containing protein
MHNPTRQQSTGDSLEQRIAERTAYLEALNTELRESIQALEGRCRSLSDHPLAITYFATLDKTRSTIYISCDVETLLGFSATTFLADPHLWFKQVHPDDRILVMDELQHSYRIGTTFRAEYRMLTSDGCVVWVRDESEPLIHPTRSSRYIQGIMLNITSQKQPAAEHQPLHVPIISGDHPLPPELCSTPELDTVAYELGVEHLSAYAVGKTWDS